jgi:hypothetical protein
VLPEVAYLAVLAGCLSGPLRAMKRIGISMCLRERALGARTGQLNINTDKSSYLQSRVYLPAHQF